MCSSDLLVSFCREHSLAIISDEVFSDFTFENQPGGLVRSVSDEQDVLTFSLSGLSKIGGLPQVKAGWIAIAGPADERRRAFERLEVIADTYLSVGTPVQHALPALLAHGETVRQQIQQRTKRNLQLLRKSSLRPLHVEGGWYAITPTPRTRTEEEWAIHLLETEQTLTQPGYFYDFESDGWLVLSLLTPEADFASGVAAIERAFTA